MRISLKRRSVPPIWQRLLLPISAILLAVLLSSILIIWAGADVLKAWYLVFSGSLGSRYVFFETLVKMSPLVFTGLAVAVAFRAKFWNIGAEGQLYAGAFAAAALGVVPLDLPKVVHIPILLIGGFVLGGLLGAFPGYLKARFKADDVVTTLLMNYIIIYLLGALLDGPWRDPATMWPHSPHIAESAIYPIFFARSRVHLGVLLMLVAAAIIYVMMEKTTLGYRIKAVGENPRASEFGGIPANRVIVTAAFLSGGLAGLAGVGEVCAIQRYLIIGISPGYGFFGIVIAMLGRLHPIGVVLAAFYFAMIISGAESMSRITKVPVYLAEVIQGITLLTMLLAMVFDRYRLKIEFKKR